MKNLKLEIFVTLKNVSPLLNKQQQKIKGGNSEFGTTPLIGTIKSNPS